MLEAAPEAPAVGARPPLPCEGSMGSCTHKWLYRAIRFRSAAFSAAQPRPEPDAQRSRRSSPRAGTVHSRSRNNTDVSLPLQEVLARQCHHHRHGPKARIYELSSSAGARRSQSARGTRHAMAGDGSAAVTKGGLGSPRNFRNLKPGMALLRARAGAGDDRHRRPLLPQSCQRLVEVDLVGDGRSRAG